MKRKLNLAAFLSGISVIVFEEVYVILAFMKLVGCPVKITSIFSISFAQYNDEHHTRGHYQHIAISQYDQILEGTTRDLCHAEASGGACQECAISQTSTYCGHFMPEVGTHKENKENQTLVGIISCWLHNGGNTHHLFFL